MRLVTLALLFVSVAPSATNAEPQLLDRARNLIGGVEGQSGDSSPPSGIKDRLGSVWKPSGGGGSGPLSGIKDQLGDDAKPSDSEDGDEKSTSTKTAAPSVTGSPKPTSQAKPADTPGSQQPSGSSPAKSAGLGLFIAVAAMLVSL